MSSNFIRWNSSSHIYQLSTDEGSTFGNLPLNGSIINEGVIALARGGTGVDLSASGSATKVLAQDASHVISARDLIAADIPSLAASKITTGQLALARGGTNADLSATGGTSKFLRQNTAGAAIDVVQLASTDLSDGPFTAPVSGSWTPVIGGDGGVSGQTYSQQIGRYVQVGKFVFAAFRVTLTAKGTITGSVWIQGLPVASVNVTSLFQVAMFNNFLMATSWIKIFSRIEINSTNAYLCGTNASGTTDLNFLTTADIANNTTLIGNFAYITN